MKIIAKLKKWNGETKEKRIKKSWVDDIVFAVEGQLNVVNKKTGLSINGSEFAQVDIYKVEEK